MEKVLDSGQRRLVMANITNKVQSQVLATCNQLQKTKSNQKQRNQELKNNLSDYTAFKNNLIKSHNITVPSVFSILQISDKKINFANKRENFREFSYPLLGLGTQDLIELSSQLIQKDKNKEFYSGKNLKHILTMISKGYNAVAYHSFTHGVSLLHLLYNCFEMDQNLKNIYTNEERCFCLLAAAAHDINHPGTNNAYQNKRNSEWCQIAQKEGVLQKMHIRYFFEIISKEKHLDFDKNSTNPLRMKELITRIILSTDITKHFQNLEKLQRLIKNKEFSPQNYDHRYFLMENLFHACDIGNPCLPYKQYINWAILVTFQFNNQSELQAQHNYEISPFFTYKGPKSFYLGQSNFINVFIYPLWKQISLSWPGIKPLIHNISKNMIKLKMKSEQQPIEQQQMIEIA